MIRISSIFRPFNIPPRKIIKLSRGKDDTVSKGYKLLCQYGFIRPSAPGMYCILPLGQRVIDKFSRFLDRYMTRVGAHKVTLPLMSKQYLWEKAETYEKSREELFELEDRKNQKYVLNPTHEQAFSHLFSTELMSYRDFPKLLYQIAPKFRDEHRPKLGLLRGKEFLMKDLYSFDIGPEEAAKTYDKVTDAYAEIFNALGVDFVRVASLSESNVAFAHEYFYRSEVGDDKLYSCVSCESTFQVATIANRHNCPVCHKTLSEDRYFNAIEVAHTFSFGTSFSNRLGSCFVDMDCKRSPLYMCSFGIGVSRMVSACAEALSTEEGELRWPVYIAPYTLCVIPPKAGSVEEQEIKFLLPDFYRLLEAIPTLNNDILIDDRGEYTIGKRLLEAKLIGCPYILIIGKDSTNSTPLYELIDLNHEKRYLMPRTSILQFLIRETEILSDSHSKLAYISDTPTASS